MKRLIAAVALVGAWSISAPAQAWDPIGDLMNPGRIVENVKREVGNAGAAVDRMRIEAQANAGAPVFETWLRQSRNDASNGAMPIPPDVRRQLEGFYDSDLLNSVRYKVGDPGVFNLSNLSIQYGSAQAVALIDVVVFKNGQQAQTDAELWAHELRHVKQFRDWGVRDFTVKYLRSWNSVEGEAYEAQQAFVNWAQTRTASAPLAPPPFAVSAPPPMMASACGTPFGMCPMPPGANVGTPCYCMTMSGPLYGVSR